jgi:hypothetical protein
LDALVDEELDKTSSFIYKASLDALVDEELDKTPSFIDKASLDAVVDEALYKNIFIHLQGEIRFICG